MAGGAVDIRVPIGLMFGIVGVIISIYGLMTRGQPMYDEHSLGININLWWGLVLIAFSLTMLGLAWNAAKKGKKEVARI